MSDQETYARELATSGVFAAQTLNNRIVNAPEFRTWSNETLMLASAALSAGFARVVELPEEDFIELCRASYQLIRAEPKTKDEVTQ